MIEDESKFSLPLSLLLISSALCKNGSSIDLYINSGEYIVHLCSRLYPHVTTVHHYVDLYSDLCDNEYDTGKSG